MKFSAFCTIVAIVGVLFSLSFLIFPAQTAANYGSHLDADGESVARLFGAALAGLSITPWIVRHQDATSVGARAMLWGSVVFNVIVAISLTLDIMHKVLNSLTWSSVAISGLIAIGALSFLGKKKTAA